jgi:hypothetical protein
VGLEPRFDQDTFVRAALPGDVVHIAFEYSAEKKSVCFARREPILPQLA